MAAALLAVLVVAGPTAANEPQEWLLDADHADLREPPLLHVPGPDDAMPIPPVRDPAPSPPAPSPTPVATPTATPTPEPAPVGYDVSYPQCGDEYPDTFGFAIVGVNGGRVYDINPCFAPGGTHPSQLAWAGRDAQLYFNTGNPGPALSRYWPGGQEAPRGCETADSPARDSEDCAYTYGWNATEHAYEAALAAYVELGWAEDGDRQLPEEVAIWLDVEEANSWRGDRALNVAALEGAVAYLEAIGVDRIGFYSTPRLWNRITGGTDVFADHPAWHAGASDRADAERRCAEERGFTGGELAMVQWVEDDLDHNVRCEDLVSD